MRRDGTVPPWPSFVLGGADPDAADTLREYARRKEARGVHPGFVAALRRWADWMDAYRAAQGDGDPEMGPHRIDDQRVVELMHLGQSA
jgi:hypothetical protein